MKEHELVRGVFEVLPVRKLRNECRESLTNSTGHINILGQAYWYYSYYRKAVDEKEYRIFVAYNEEEKPVGYGALHLKDEQLFITECVAQKHRKKGHGGRILSNLISVADEEGLPLVAEILADNEGSIALHTKYGFILDTTRTEPDREICVYRRDKKHV